MREDLHRQLKLISVVEGKQIQDLIEEAISEYLAKRKITEKKSSEGEWTVRYRLIDPDDISTAEDDEKP